MLELFWTNVKSNLQNECQSGLICIYSISHSYTYHHMSIKLNLVKVQGMMFCLCAVNVVSSSKCSITIQPQPTTRI